MDAYIGGKTGAQLLHVSSHTDMCAQYICATVGVPFRAVIKCSALIYILVRIKSRKIER